MKCMAIHRALSAMVGKCVDQLLKAHPDKFKRSDKPEVGAVFSVLGEIMSVLSLAGMVQILQSKKGI